MIDGLFIDILLWAVYILLVVTAGLAVWSAVHGVQTHERSSDALASRRTSMLGYATAGFVAVVLLLTFLFASTRPIVTGGRAFTDALWLRLTDMFIFTPILLICVCSAVIAIAKFRR